ncbi:Tetraacyldisaccharide 4'-kinase [hydrothermal vent metagenome]|uniref:tetraacyldisaccharide 4'-kinase n=1 Tax=hydrothermal vent metagenome TaxID=652676 RepID=A0A3B1E943_9ZZZZ
MIGYKSIYIWVEQYLFFPNIFQKLISILLLPITILFCIITVYKRATAKPFDFKIPIISVGNLIVGGSGKTPVTIAIAKNKKDIAIILRGYGRKSKGLKVVSNHGNILVDTQISGDEAMLLATSLTNATIIVSNNREEGILKAKQLDSKIIILDDAFHKYNIKKFDILIRPKIEPTNIFCLPSGGYRETKIMYSFASLVLQDGIDFTRIVTFNKNNQIVKELPKRLILLTAISKPKRLLEFLHEDTIIVSYPDHYYFKQDDLEQVKTKYPNYSIITTQKDEVKLRQFDIKNLYIMNLDINITQENINRIDNFIG